jgi:hypothetical protein
MAAAFFQKEKDAAEKDELKAAIEKDNLNAAAVTPKDVDKQMCEDEPEIVPPHEPLPTVVSPPSAPNLTSLLTSHVGQEVGTQAADNTTATDTDINTQVDEQVDDNVKSPKKRKSKKLSPQKKINCRSVTVAAQP